MNQDKRQQVLERDEFECQFCEMTNKEHEEKYGRGIEVHHVVPRKADGSDKKKNLLTVCRSCHSTLEKTQGNLLKRLYNNDKEEELEELRKTNEKLEDELEDRYTFDELIDAVDDRFFRAKIYIEIKKATFSNMFEIGQITHDRDEILKRLEDDRGGHIMERRTTSVNLAEILRKNQSSIAKRIERKQDKNYL